jgi:small nuclear ribonucleoprotein (snRNP)-like protein
LIFSTCSLVGVVTTAVYVLVVGIVIVFDSVMNSKLEDDEGIEEEKEGEEKEGNRCSQSVFIKSSQI